MSSERFAGAIPVLAAKLAKSVVSVRFKGSMPWLKSMVAFGIWLPWKFAVGACWSGKFGYAFGLLGKSGIESLGKFAVGFGLSGKLGYWFGLLGKSGTGLLGKSEVA
jgi:hypothetical protein